MKQESQPYFQGKALFLFLENKRWISALAAFIGGASLLIVSLQSGPNSETFMAAEEAVLKWEETQDEASFQEMRKVFRKVPALQKKYEARIAQKLFEEDRISEALSFANSSLARIQKDVPFHASYGETSLLIEQGAYQAALEKSVGLKEEMLKSLAWEQVHHEVLGGGALLYAHNLLRIAFLQKELDNKPGEKAAWEELESFLKEKEGVSSLVLGNFRDKGLNLTDYIAERKKCL